MEKIYEVRISRLVELSDLPNLDAPIRSRIISDMAKKLRKNPVAYTKPLSGTLRNMRSLRVGSYRVVFSVEEEIITVHVIAIGHRADIYDLVNRRTG